MKIQSVQIDPHFTPAFYAELWRVSVSTVVRMFQDHPDVLKLGESSNNGKRSRRGLRIPFSVAIRAHEERSK
jgi:hypothetical protein